MIVLTATGDRLTAFTLCRRWMAEQTYKNVRWVVVDDGTTRVDAAAEVLYRQPRPTDPKHTMATNILYALDTLKLNDDIVFFEDDDYYAPTYLETMAGMLKQRPFVGFDRVIYYRLNHRTYKQHLLGPGFSILGMIGIRAEFIPQLREACARCVAVNWYGVDTVLNDLVPRNRKLTVRSHLHVGIKGLPGRGGMSDGWRYHETTGWCPDEQLRVFKRVCPAWEAYNLYLF